MIDAKISIIIPVYNCEKFLDRTLNSVLSQSYENLEIILVDDCSQDASLSICQKYLEKDGRIKLIHLDQNAGVSNARNVGIENATGKFLQFVDSDDYLQQDCCKILVGNILAADLVICGFCEKGEKDDIFTTGEEKQVNFRDDYKFFFELVKNRQINNVWNKLYKKEKLSQSFDNSISIGEDVLFNLNYLQNCENVKVIKDVLYNYDFTNFNSIMHTKYREKQEFFDYWKKIYAFCDDQFKDKNYIKILNGLFIKAIMAQIMNLAFRKKLNYGTFRKLFYEYRNLPDVKNALKKFKRNVFVNKSRLESFILFTVFKMKLVFPFSIITKYRNRKLDKEKK